MLRTKKKNGGVYRSDSTKGGGVAQCGPGHTELPIACTAGLRSNFVDSYFVGHLTPRCRFRAIPPALALIWAGCLMLQTKNACCPRDATLYPVGGLST
jgi:hypothetical protein